METGLESRTVIITGGGSNIGRATALAFAREKANVVIADIDEEQGQKVVQICRQFSRSCIYVNTDVTDMPSVNQMVNETVQTFGSVDVLVNNVGWGHGRLFTEKDDEELEKEIKINLWSTIYCTRVVLRYMIQYKKGAIVNLSSDAGRIGESRTSGYSASKAAIIGITKTLARELGCYNIRVNTVSPGTILPSAKEDVGSLSMWAPGGSGAAWNTPEMHSRISKGYPLGRLGKPEEVANAIVFLASDAASYITGQTLSVSGGATMQ